VEAILGGAGGGRGRGLQGLEVVDGRGEGGGIEGRHLAVPEVEIVRPRLEPDLLVGGRARQVGVRRPVFIRKPVAEDEPMGWLHLENLPVAARLVAAGPRHVILDATAGNEIDARNEIGIDHASQSAAVINRGDLDAVERVLHVTMAFQLQDDSEGLRKFFAFWVVEGRLLVAQQLELNRRLKEMGMPEIIEWWLEEGHAKGRLEGIEEGIRASKREDARKMLVEGCEWSFITRITGIKPEDLG